MIVCVSRSKQSINTSEGFGNCSGNASVFLIIPSLSLSPLSLSLSQAVQCVRRDWANTPHAVPPSLPPFPSHLTSARRSRFPWQPLSFRWPHHTRNGTYVISPRLSNVYGHTLPSHVYIHTLYHLMCTFTRIDKHTSVGNHLISVCL